MAREGEAEERPGVMVTLAAPDRRAVDDFVAVRRVFSVLRLESGAPSMMVRIVNRAPGLFDTGAEFDVIWPVRHGNRTLIRALPFVGVRATGGSTPVRGVTGNVQDAGVYRLVCCCHTLVQYPCVDVPLAHRLFSVYSGVIDIDGVEVPVTGPAIGDQLLIGMPVITGQSMLIFSGRARGVVGQLPSSYRPPEALQVVPVSPSAACGCFCNHCPCRKCGMCSIL